MKAIILAALCVLAIDTSVYAQKDSTKKLERKMDRQERQEMRKNSTNLERIEDGNPANRINNSTAPMNSNGNNTPTQNATRAMNEGPRRSALDTTARNK